MASENLSCLRKFCENQTNVALTLTKQVISTEAKDKNFIFSPLSIHVILGLTAAGSEGPTQEELLAYLKSESSYDFNSSMSRLVELLFADGSLGLSCANGIWVDKKFLLEPVFKEMAENVYKAVVDRVDFEHETEDAIKQVNEWGAKKTNGLITEILPPDDVERVKSTSLMTTNALYFKGAWRESFREEFTTRHKFFLLDGSSVYASYMTSNQDQFISTFVGFKVLKLPYESHGDSCLFSMYIYLPEYYDELPALVEKITSEPGFVELHLPSELVEVGDFRIPKFKIQFGFDVTEVLNELGVVSMFRGGITKLVDSETSVSRVLHKAFIEVNEEGTEAAAITLENDLCGCCEDLPKRMDFVAEHPFLFVIREDNTGAVFFVGQVLNPSIKA